MKITLSTLLSSLSLLTVSHSSEVMSPMADLKHYSIKEVEVSALPDPFYTGQFKLTYEGGGCIPFYCGKRGLSRIQLIVPLHVLLKKNGQIAIYSDNVKLTENDDVFKNNILSLGYSLQSYIEGSDVVGCRINLLSSFVDQKVEEGSYKIVFNLNPVFSQNINEVQSTDIIAIMLRKLKSADESYDNKFNVRQSF